MFKDKSNSLANIISFSGLPEWKDEALSFILGYSLRLTEECYSKKIIEISNNPFLEEMLNKFKKTF